MTKPVAWRSDVVARRSDGTSGTGVASNDRERHPRRVRRRGGSDGHRPGTATHNPAACPLPMRAGPAPGILATGGTQDGRVAPQKGKGQVGWLGGGKDPTAAPQLPYLGPAQAAGRLFLLGGVGFILLR